VGIKHTMSNHSSYPPLYSLLNNKREIIIGRDPSCDLVLSDPYVSRQHCRVFVESNKYFIEDLTSTNGTYINNIRIRKIQEIKESDEIILGFQVLHLKNEGINTTDALAIEINQLSVVLNNKTIIHPFSAEVSKARFLAIMGPSGSGKSTIIKALTGFLPYTGEIKIFGLDLRKYEQYIFSKMGYVAQTDYLPNDLTVKDIMHYAFHLKKYKLDHNIDKDLLIQQTLEKVNLYSPEHLQKKVKQLSGGEKKRLSIAVEMLSKPALLILDEPTSPLDPETIREFLSYLKKIQEEGTTIIMVTHKTEDIQYADFLWFLGRGGKLCYIGPPGDIISTFHKNNYLDIYELLSNPQNVDDYALQFINNKPEKSSSNNPLQKSSLISSLHHLKVQLNYFYWLSLRYAKNKGQQGLNFWLLILLQPLIIPILIYFIFEKFQISNLFMLSITAIWFGISNSSREIVDEWPLFIKEKKYGISAISFYFSRFLILSLITFLQILIMVFTTNWLYYSNDVHIFNFEKYLWTLQLSAMSAISMGLFVSSLFTEAVKVISITPLVLIPQILLSGVIAPLDNPVKEYLSTLIISRWTTECLSRIQDEHAPYFKEQVFLFNPQKDTIFEEIKPCEPLKYCPGSDRITIKIPKDIKVNYQSQRRLQKLSIYQQVPVFSEDTFVIENNKDTIPYLTKEKKYEKVVALDQLHTYSKNSSLLILNNYESNLWALIIIMLLFAVITVIRLHTVKIIL